MGYPMTYDRVINRNRLHGNYAWDRDNPPERAELEMLIGDLRRLEQDSQDDQHLRLYSAYAGCSYAQAKALLHAFFHSSETIHGYGGEWFQEVIYGAEMARGYGGTAD